MQCPRCGNQVPEGALFCTVCGLKLDVRTEMSAPDPQEVQADMTPTETQEAQLDMTPMAPQEAQPDMMPMAPQDVQPEMTPAVPQEVPPDMMPTAPQMPDEAPKAAPKKKKKTGKILAALAVLVALLAMGGIFVLKPAMERDKLVQRYNEGTACLENGDYSQALAIFDELGEFEDAAYWKEYAQNELDYKTIERLKASKDYDKIISILEKRAEYYKPSKIEQEASALAKEYKTLKGALAAYEAGNHAEALAQFEALQTLGSDFGREQSLCRAHIAEEEHRWGDILIQLYAVMKGDPDCTFLEEPQDETDNYFQEVFESGADEISAWDVVVTEDEETQALKQTAVDGLHYERGARALAEGDFERAMDILDDIPGFLDADALYEEARAGQEAKEEEERKRKEEEERKRQEEEKARQEAMAKTYKEAEELYDNGEYYKAKQLFESVSEYEDAYDRAEACVQPLPETGDYLVSGGSSSSLTIEAPSGDNAVYIKVYDTDGNTVCKTFIRSGESATVWIDGGTYTMKVAYGTEWYGEIDVFGDYGTYSQLMNGDTELFELNNGYTYTLQLLASTEGNVGSQDVEGGAGGM